MINMVKYILNHAKCQHITPEMVWKTYYSGM